MSVQLNEARQCQNQLLSRLDDTQYQLLLPMLDLVHTAIKDILVHQGDAIEFVYFPCTSAHSCVINMEDGAMVEVGTIGNESFTTVELMLGAETALETVVCQIAGQSLRMTASDFRKALETQPALREILQCSAQAYLAQVSQSAACNRLHNIEMRFARWLLVTHDRVQGDEFSLTQEFVATMLGVHRPSVSLVASVFQQAGLIKYTRGHMQILDRAKLEETSCECYSMTRGHFTRLLGTPHG